MIIPSFEGRLPEHLINEAYITIRKVADNLTEITELYDMLSSGGASSELFSNIATIVANLESINTVGSILTNGTNEYEKAIDLFNTNYGRTD